VLNRFITKTRKAEYQKLKRKFRAFSAGGGCFRDYSFASDLSGLGGYFVEILSPVIKGEIMSDQVVYTSKSKIERIKGPLRRAYLPQVKEPVFFGVHSEIAAHYGVDPQVHEPQATTLDYVVASAAG